MKSDIEKIQEILNGNKRSEGSNNTCYTYPEKIDAIINFMNNNREDYSLLWLEDIKDRCELGIPIPHTQKLEINRTLKKYYIKISDNL